MMMADVVANLGGMVIEKSQEPDPTVSAVHATSQALWRAVNFWTKCPEKGEPS
jgi:hypothetical protein